MAKHGWVSETSSIGAVSYIPVQVWQQVPRQRQFRAVWYKDTVHLALPRFNHLPASKFLHLVPPQAIQILPNGLLELSQPVYDSVFSKYLPQTASITIAVNNLVATLRKRKET